MVDANAVGRDMVAAAEKDLNTWRQYTDLWDRKRASKMEKLLIPPRKSTVWFDTQLSRCVPLYY